MSESPYAQPASHVADRPGNPRPPRPKQVAVAVGLLWLGFGIDLLVAYFQAERDSTEDFGPSFFAGVAVALVIAVVVNTYVYRGSNWARIALLLLTLVGVVFFFFPSEDPAPAQVLERTLDFLSSVLSVIATYLVFSPPGSHWFRRPQS